MHAFWMHNSNRICDLAASAWVRPADHRLGPVGRPPARPGPGRPALSEFDSSGCTTRVESAIWPTDWSTGRPADRPIGWPIDWSDRSTGWPTDWSTGRPADRPTGRPVDRPTGRPGESDWSDRSTGRPADWSTGRPAGHLSTSICTSTSTFTCTSICTSTSTFS